MSKEVGDLGERLAADYLAQAGYEILERNWRFHRAEVDLIARHENVIVIVEVKLRHGQYFGPPQVFISKKKQRLLAFAASAYQEQLDHAGQVRFDAVAITQDRVGNYRIQHLPDAFFPGLYG